MEGRSNNRKRVAMGSALAALLVGALLVWAVLSGRGESPDTAASHTPTQSSGALSSGPTPSTSGPAGGALPERESTTSPSAPASPGWKTTREFLETLFTTSQGQTVAIDGLGRIVDGGLLQPGAWLEIEGLSRIDELAGSGHPSCEVKLIEDIAVPAQAAETESAMILAHAALTCGGASIDVTAEVYPLDDQVTGLYITNVNGVDFALHEAT